MEILAQKLIEYFDKNTCPYVRQNDIINLKYQKFSRESAVLNKNVYVVEFSMGEFPLTKKWITKNVNLSSKNPKIEESEAFLRFFESSKVTEYLEDLGILKDDFSFIYDYASVRIDSEYRSANFNNLRTYLVFYENETYNLIKLLYKRPVNNQSLFFSFEPRIGYEDDDSRHA